ncbi:uncharacterized protein LOC117116396 isoform X2 [Anneissia japonica]|uniref:uncharacterized protein LOC117116396 isoform X2 n=1 Tax=Anneissia japonica TaxID=1529436 RepID=UPI0014258E3E|nr:uncharacterized protein LOC117116396 isoform X2 [Anneissia japonica]
MDPSSRGFQLLSLARKKFREKTSKSNHHPPTQNRLLSDDKVRKWLQRSKLSCHQEDIDSLLPEDTESYVANSEIESANVDDDQYIRYKSIKGVMIHEQKTSSKMLKNKECVKQRNGVNDVVTRECNERKDESSVHGGEQPMILNQAEQNTSIAQPITLPEVESGDTSADQVISPLVAESGIS